MSIKKMDCQKSMLLNLWGYSQLHHRSNTRPERQQEHGTWTVRRQNPHERQEQEGDDEYEALLWPL